MLCNGQGCRLCREAPGELGDTVEHIVEAGQHQASLGREALGVPEGMPSRRIQAFLFNGGGHMLYSPYNHSRCQLSQQLLP